MARAAAREMAVWRVGRAAAVRAAAEVLRVPETVERAALEEEPREAVAMVVAVEEVARVGLAMAATMAAMAEAAEVGAARS